MLIIFIPASLYKQSCWTIKHCSLLLFFFNLVCSTRIKVILKYTWKTAVISKNLRDSSWQWGAEGWSQLFGNVCLKNTQQTLKCLGVCTRVSHLHLSANKPRHKFLIYIHTSRFGHTKSGKGKSLGTISFASLGKCGSLCVFWERAHLPLSSWVIIAVMANLDRKHRENRWTFKRGQEREREEFPSDD